MNTTDFLACLGITALAGASTYFHFYYITVLAVMVFVLFIVNMTIFYLSQPLPRLVVIVGDACDECDCEATPAPEEPK